MLFVCHNSRCMHVCRGCVECYVSSCNMLVLTSFVNVQHLGCTCVIMLTYHTCHIYNSYDSHNRHDIPIFQSTWHYLTLQLEQST
jgi:hypothetical protein